MRSLRVRNAIAVLAVAFVVLCTGASAAERAGPTWLAADYIAAHPAESQEWRLHYGAHDFGSELGDAFVIGLADTYAYVETPTRITIYDFAVERVLTFDRVANRFDSASFYMHPAAVLGELQNRLKVIAPLLQMLEQGGGTGAVPLTSVDRFWIESDLGVLGPPEGAPAISVTDEADGTTRYVYAEEVVATIVAVEHAITAEAAHGLDIVLRRLTRLHPAILADVAARNVIPQSLSYVIYGTDNVARTVSIELREIEERNSAYPLPASATPGDGGLSPTLAPLVAQVRGFVAGERDERFRTDSDYQQAAIAAAAQGNWLAVQLILFERQLQYGPEAPCEDPSVCFDVAANEGAMLADPDVIAYQAALEQDQSGGDPKTVIATLQGFDRSSFMNPAIVDLLVANTMSVNRIEPEDGAPGPEQLLLGYIESNPYVGAAYNDLGQHLWRAQRPAEAWQMFDLARAFGPVPGLAPLMQIDQAEQTIKRAAPAFFQ